MLNMIGYDILNIQFYSYFLIIFSTEEMKTWQQNPVTLFGAAVVLEICLSVSGSDLESIVTSKSSVREEWSHFWVCVSPSTSSCVCCSSEAKLTQSCSSKSKRGTRMRGCHEKSFKNMVGEKSSLFIGFLCCLDKTHHFINTSGNRASMSQKKKRKKKQSNNQYSNLGQDVYYL